ncbi:MAG TPA: tyrosine-type recombinase/integrase [Bryobacteraceae bacterium]|nr:tyrosine-type recombinase/integrase [Bryobacteraceae bacterium]
MRVGLLATTLQPGTVAGYRHTVKLFLAYLHGAFPQLRQPSELRRDPHVLGWLEHLWKRRAQGSGQPLTSHSRAQHVIRLRHLFELLADHPHAPRPGLWRSEDIPKPDQLLPRPLTPGDDAALQAELHRRSDLFSNALLLVRLTGMRIGEGADLAPHCLRHLGQDDWAIHVPLGKLHSERWVPVEEEIRSVVARLLFLRTLPPAADPEFLLPRPKGRAVLCNDLRTALREAAQQAGITTRIVPHQLRHTYATSMLRAGVSLPALMRLLGHRTANMTLRYVQITQQDLQREFHLARQAPRHRIPLPPAAVSLADPPAADAAGVLDRLNAAMRVLDLFRQQNPACAPKPLRLLARRLLRVRSVFQKSVLNPDT